MFSSRKTTITENVGNGIAVGILSAADADISDSFTYTMVDDAGGRFAIDGNKLVVAKGQLLNYEAKTTHDVQVQVTDSAGNSFTKTITVQLIDVNETPFNLKSSKTTITENVANGTAVGLLSATDPDSGDTLSYTMVDNAGGRFAIDGNKLVVTNGSLLNFEAKSTYDVQVRVTDAGGKSSVKTFTIQLQNVNETPYNLSISKTTITEHVGNGVAVGVLSAIDPDAGDTLTYTLLDNAGGRFAIDGNKLVVANGSLLDYEKQTTHDVVVLVTDAGGKSTTKTFTVQLQDVNETPYNIQISKTSIAENTLEGTVIGNLSATDPDAGDTRTFTLLDDAGGRFSIIDNKLVVANGSLLDFETASSHTIQVRVTDAGGKFSTKTFTIGVTDVSEGTVALAQATPSEPGAESSQKIMPEIHSAHEGLSGGSPFDATSFPELAHCLGHW